MTSFFGFQNSMILYELLRVFESKISWHFHDLQILFGMISHVNKLSTKSYRQKSLKIKYNKTSQSEERILRFCSKIPWLSGIGKIPYFFKNLSPCITWLTGKKKREIWSELHVVVEKQGALAKITQGSIKSHSHLGVFIPLVLVSRFFAAISAGKKNILLSFCCRARG